VGLLSLVSAAQSCKPAPSAALNGSHPLSPGLMAAYIFAEAGGRLAVDMTGRSRQNLVLTSPIWGAGSILGSTFDANGSTTTGVSSATTSDVGYLGAISIAMHVLIRDGGHFHEFVTKGAGNGASNTPFEFRTSSAASPILQCARADSAGHNGAWGGPLMPVGKFTHIGVTFADGVGSTIPNFYVDGVLTASSGSSTVITAGGSSAPLRIGQRGDGAVKLNGQVSYLYIWSRALSRADMWSIMVDPYGMFD
jgi:hypothetical protein